MIAAACTAVSGFALATGHNVSTTTFDLLSTTVLGWLAVRALLRHSGRDLLAAGAVVGVGFEAKPQVGIVAFVLLCALAAVGPRWPLGSPQLWAGVAVAVVLAAPYLGWQAAHGWPQATVAYNIAGDAEGGRAGFLPFQLVMVSPLLVPVWVAGLAVAWRRFARDLRAVAVTYVALGCLYVLGDGKAYYLASLYPLLLGIGGVPAAAWLSRGRRRLRRGLLTAAITVSAAVSAIVALPLLPADELQGSATMALNPDIGEQVGWPRLASTVDRVWLLLPARRRAHTVIVTASYGEAGAVDQLGRPLGLPRAYSGHNAYTEWGRPGTVATSVLLLGYSDPASAGPQFTDCQVKAHADNGVGLNNNEQGLPIMLCRPTTSWTKLWPQLRHYN